jgi:hypothetical protein
MRDTLSCAEQLLPSTAQDATSQTATAIRRIIIPLPLRIPDIRRAKSSRLPKKSPLARGDPAESGGLQRLPGLVRSSRLTKEGRHYPPDDCVRMRSDYRVVGLCHGLGANGRAFRPNADGRLRR